MDKVHGMRCAAELVWWSLIVLEVVGFVTVLLIMLRGKRIAKWRSVRWAPEAVCGLCGIPFGQKLQMIGHAMISRYPHDRKSDALSYTDRIIDRQINKARGILPFNSILIAAVALENGRDVGPVTILLLKYLAHPILAGLFISSLLLLIELFWVRWAGLEGYRTFEREVANNVVTARDRSIILDMAVTLSVACIIALLLAVIGPSVVRWAYEMIGIRGSLNLCWR